MMQVHQDQRLSIISSTWEPCSVSFRSFHCHPRFQIKSLVLFEQKAFPIGYLLPFQLQKVDFALVFLCFQINLFLALDLVWLLSSNCLELVTFFFHSCFCVRNFHRFLNGNKFVCSNVMVHRTLPFRCDAVFVASWKSRFRRQSCGFMRLHYTSVLRLRNFAGCSPLLQFPDSKKWRGFFFLQGVAVSMCTSNFRFAFFKVSSNAWSPGSTK